MPRNPKSKRRTMTLAQTLEVLSDDPDRDTIVNPGQLRLIQKIARARRLLAAGKDVRKGARREARPEEISTYEGLSLRKPKGVASL